MYFRNEAAHKKLTTFYDAIICTRAFTRSILLMIYCTFHKLNYRESPIRYSLIIAVLFQPKSNDHKFLIPFHPLFCVINFEIMQNDVFNILASAEMLLLLPCELPTMA